MGLGNIFGFISENIGGIGGAVVALGALWRSRQIKKALEAFVDVAQTIIKVRKDGKVTDEEIKELIDVTVKLLNTLIPFYQRWTKRKIVK